jgi:calcium-dependent protein kinase
MLRVRGLLPPSRAAAVARRSLRRLSSTGGGSAATGSANSSWMPVLAGGAAAAAVAVTGVYAYRQLLQPSSQPQSSSSRPEDNGEVPRSQLTKRYNLEKSLGKGGFGEVWLATDRRTGQKVAVKVLSLKQLPRSMVEQEITAMRRCGQHPNVVALLDVVWVQPDNINPYGEAVLVMELAAGGGLFERLVEEGAYSEEYAAKITRQIAVALYHLHSRGIVHRDIKPENVVFESEEKGQVTKLSAPDCVP